MKRIFLYVIMTFLLISLYFTSLEHKVLATNIEDNSVIILSGSVNEDKKLVIKATMQENTGIGSMTLEVSYDVTAMALSNVEFGSALSSLEPMTTNPHTEKGYAITPFKINYLGQENDFTTGLMFTLTFDLSENISDGSYIVTLKYTRDKDVNYYDENKDVKTKNLFIDYAEVKIKNNSVTNVVSVSETKKEVSYTWVIVVSSAVGGALLTWISIVVVKKLVRRKKNWEKL